MSSPERMAVGFAIVLRAERVSVAVGRVVAYAEALAAVGLERQAGVYWAGRATLLSSPEDVEAYDRAFEAFWLRGDRVVADVASDDVPSVVERETAFDADGDDDAVVPHPLSADATEVRYSASEVLRRKDFAAYSPDEVAEARALMADMRLAGALRRSRRMVPSRRRRGRPDLRRTLHAAMRSGGEVIARPRVDRSWRPRRLVLLCDVSGSMEPYARALVRFLHVAVAGRQQVEAFAVGTRLTRITRELSSRDPDRALADAARAVADWAGGTRLGDGLRRFNDEWGVRGMARGAVVVILSDGWDRGDPDLLADELRRLRRVAHRVVWVNPLKATPGYAPLARGMAAALPHVDEFVDGHSLASLEVLAEVVRR